MAVLDINVLVDDTDRRLRVHLVDLAGGAEIPGHEVLDLLFLHGEPDFEVGGHDTHGHVVNAPFWHGTVDDGNGEVLTSC